MKNKQHNHNKELENSCCSLEEKMETKNVMIANTPKPPYYAVIFSSARTDGDNGYSEMTDYMVELVKQQDGFLGVESANNKLGITVSYWRDLQSIKTWKENTEHSIAREKGRNEWYEFFKVRIARVERDYEFEKK